MSILRFGVLVAHHRGIALASMRRDYVALDSLLVDGYLGSKRHVEPSLYGANERGGMMRDILIGLAIGVILSAIFITIFFLMP